MPRELFVVERVHLKLLPVWVPDVYRLHHRIVDVEGYVTVHTNRYSVWPDWIGQRVEVRETKDQFEIQNARGVTVSHERLVDVMGQRITLQQHRIPRGQGIKRSHPPPEEKAICDIAPEVAHYATALKQKGRKQPTLALRQLLRMIREYPRQPLVLAIAEASQYGLYDLDRVERMVLRRIAREFFLLDKPKPEGDAND